LKAFKKEIISRSSFIYAT